MSIIYDTALRLDCSPCGIGENPVRPRRYMTVPVDGWGEQENGSPHGLRLVFRAGPMSRARALEVGKVNVESGRDRLAFVYPLLPTGAALFCVYGRRVGL